MKFIHLSDLHIGKRVNQFSMLEDQEYILKKIIEIADREKPACVIIAGDIYDKAVPSAEAVQLFDDFLYLLMKRKLKVFVISGNHDSPERIAFGARIMDQSGIYLSPVYSGRVEPVTLRDEYGEVDVFLLPFIKPVHVRRFSPEEEIESYTDAVRTAISHMPIHKNRRNILVTHQFVTGATRCESEEISIGGSDNVDASVFEDFDYTALGHLHGPQSVGRENVRYSGSPLKYSFSEAGHKKTVTVLDLKEKGNMEIQTVPLVPKRDLCEIRGSYMEVTARDFYKDRNTEDYFHITLTDEEDIPEAVGKLRAVYPNIMKLDYDNMRTRAGGMMTAGTDSVRRTPLQLFEEFFEIQNGQEMTEQQLGCISELMEKIWEEEE